MGTTKSTLILVIISCVASLMNALNLLDGLPKMVGVIVHGALAILLAINAVMIWKKETNA